MLKSDMLNEVQPMPVKSGGFVGFVKSGVYVVGALCLGLVALDFGTGFYQAFTATNDMMSNITRLSSDDAIGSYCETDLDTMWGYDECIVLGRHGRDAFMYAYREKPGGMSTAQLAHCYQLGKPGVNVRGHNWYMSGLCVGGVR